MPQIEFLPKFVRPTRVIGGEHPLISLSRYQLKASQLQTDPANFWYIGRIEGGVGYDLFLGTITTNLVPDIMRNLSTKPSYSRRCLANLQTAFGETVEVAVMGVINKNTITEHQRNLLSRYFNPYRETSAEVHPEVFTYASAFNYVKRDWPMINSPEHINALSLQDQQNLLTDLLSAGLGVLERESEYVHMQNAAKKFRLLGQSPFLRFHITSDIYATLRQERRIPETSLKSFAPESHSLVYFPNFDQNTPGMGEVLVPTAWMWSAFETPIPALSTLIYASSSVRDDYYNHLRGSDMYAVRYFGSAEIPKKQTALMRAEGLVAELIKEVYEYDGKIYFLNPHHDGFMREVSKKYPKGARHVSNLYYPDPPDRQKGRINQNV